MIHGVAKFNARNQDFIDLFGHIQGQNSNLQHEQTLSHNFNQLYCLNRGHIQKTIAIVKNKFSMIFNSLPKMSPNNYINPLEETFQDLNHCNHNAQDDIYYEYGRKLNYEQLMFLHKMLLEKHININISLQ